MNVLNSSILGLSIIIFLFSYKKDLKAKKCIIFYIIYILMQFILRNYIQYWISSEIYLIIKIMSYYLIMKLIFKDKVNILDAFYIMYGYFFITLSNKVLKQEIIVNIIVLMISLIFVFNREKIYKLSCKIIRLWNEDCDKALTLRNIFLICFNIIVFIILKWLLV